MCSHRRYPPPSWHSLREDLFRTRMYLVSTSGPTSYTIRQGVTSAAPPVVVEEVAVATDDGDVPDVSVPSQHTRESPTTPVVGMKNYRVLIGPVHQCTCPRQGRGGADDATGGLCIHLLFVLLKVLKIPPEDSMAWQSGLNDAEITRVLQAQERQNEAVEKRKHEYLRRRRRGQKTNAAEEGEGNSNGGGSSEVVRQAIEPGEVCAICVEEMAGDRAEELTFCRRTCGANFHVQCMKMYAEHKISSGAKVTCPLCRCDWGALALHSLKAASDAQQRERRRRRDRAFAQAASQCSECKIRLRSDRYRCVSCADYDLCRRCFDLADVRDGAGGVAGHRFGSSATARGAASSAAAAAAGHLASHIFVRTPASGAPAWRAAPQRRHAQSIPLGIVAALQSRELNVADYETLLALDQQNNPNQPLPNYLLRSLTEIAGGADTLPAQLPCAVCRGPMSAQPTRPRRLGCAHVVHESCALSLATSAAAAADTRFDFDDGESAATHPGHCRCPVSECGAPVFPGLEVKPRRPRPRSNSDSGAGTAATAGADFPATATSTSTGALRSQSAGSEPRGRRSRSRSRSRSRDRTAAASEQAEGFGQGFQITGSEIPITTTAGTDLSAPPQSALSELSRGLSRPTGGGIARVRTGTARLRGGGESGDGESSSTASAGLPPLMATSSSVGRLLAARDQQRPSPPTAEAAAAAAPAATSAATATSSNELPNGVVARRTVPQRRRRQQQQQQQRPGLEAQASALRAQVQSLRSHRESTLSIGGSAGVVARGTRHQSGGQIARGRASPSALGAPSSNDALVMHNAPSVDTVLPSSRSTDNVGPLSRVAQNNRTAALDWAKRRQDRVAAAALMREERRKNIEAQLLEDAEVKQARLERFDLRARDADERRQQRQRQQRRTRRTARDQGVGGGKLALGVGQEGPALRQEEEPQN